MYNLRHSNNLQHNAYQARVGTARAQVQDGRNSGLAMNLAIRDTTTQILMAQILHHQVRNPGLRIEGSS
jgi:hypothetical protein